MPACNVAIDFPGYHPRAVITVTAGRKTGAVVQGSLRMVTTWLGARRRWRWRHLFLALRGLWGRYLLLALRGLWRQCLFTLLRARRLWQRWWWWRRRRGRRRWWCFGAVAMECGFCGLGYLSQQLSQILQLLCRHLFPRLHQPSHVLS